MAIKIIIEVNEKKHTVLLSMKPILLGRSSACNIKFSDNLMSSKHCEISLNKEGKIVVTDLNSTNGTFVNGTKIVSSHFYIGDVLQMGSIKITIDEVKLKKSERVPLTRVQEVGKTRFIEMKSIGPKRSDFKKDLSDENEEKTNLATKVVSLEEHKKMIAAKKAELKEKKEQKARQKQAKLDDEQNQENGLRKLTRIFKKKG